MLSFTNDVTNLLLGAKLALGLPEPLGVVLGLGVLPRALIKGL